MQLINRPEKFNIKVATILGLVCFFSNGLGLLATLILNYNQINRIILQTIFAISISFIINVLLFLILHLHKKDYKKYMISVITVNGFFCFPIMLWYLGSSFLGYYCLLAIYAGFTTLKNSNKYKSIIIILVADIVYITSFIADNSLVCIESALKWKHIITITISYISIYLVSLNLYKNYIAEMVNSVEYEKELKTLAEKDGLTGAYNRKTLEQDIVKKVSTTYAIMLDIDHFKQINDNYGHKKGDEILIVLAGIIYPYREYAFQLYRYGGEEFCILSSYDEKVTLIKIKNIIDKIRSILWIEGKPVTVSFGMGAVQGSILEAIEVADENLYLAKNNGRNKLYFNKKPYFI